jgi:PAS domain S-box-containing protein
MIHPNERELVEKQVRMVLQDPAHLFSAEYRMRDRNDEWVWILSRGKSVDLDEKGGSRRVAGTLINISALKKAEADLEESEDRFRTLFEHTAQGVVYQDGRGAIITANPAAERILGLSLDQMQGRTSMDPDWRAVHEDGSDYPGEEHAISIALRSGQPVQNQSMGIFNPRDGDTRWLIINAFPHFPPGEDTPDGAFATFEDITQRKRSMEELLKKTRELDQQNAVLSALLENLPLGVFMIEAPGGRPLLANPAALALLGRGILPGADSESLAEVYDAYRVPGRTHYPAAEMPIVQAMRGFSVNVEDMLVVQPDGKELLLAVHGSPVRDSEGRVWAGLAIFMNISERKKQEARLMEQMQELQSWHEAMLGREERILSLKEEVNQQLKLNGQPPRYGGTEEGIDG